MYTILFMKMKTAAALAPTIMEAQDQQQTQYLLFKDLATLLELPKKIYSLYKLCFTVKWNFTWFDDTLEIVAVILKV